MKKSILAACLVLASQVVLLSAQEASAHSQPIRFEPAPGEVLDSAPPKIVGWFSSDIRQDPNWTFIEVTDAQGNRVDLNDTTLARDRLQVSVNLQPSLPRGRYVVTYRIWDDADGEIVSNCYTFFVGQEAADAAVAERFLLTGGSTCERFEFSARVATPAPGTNLISGAQPPATGPEGDKSNASELPVWVTILTGGLALALGLGLGMTLGRSQPPSTMDDRGAGSDR